MSLAIFVDGPARLYIGPQACLATEYADFGSNNMIGYTESGLQVSINYLTHRVNSDDCGGGEGNPAEMLVMGATATIRGTMVKYETTAINSLMAGLYGAAEGSVKLPGTPVFAGGYGFAFWAVGVNGSFYFPKCEWASAPREFNISTTERKTSFTVNAYPVVPSNCNAALYYKGPGVTACSPGCVDVYSQTVSPS